MSDITKLIDRGIPVTQRMQVFTDSDGGAGDVLLVEASLGKSASKITITATDALSVVFNTYRTVFPHRIPSNDLSSWAPGFDNLASGVQVEGNNPTIAGAAGETFVMDNDIPVDDIKLITVAGVFEIIVL